MRDCADDPLARRSAVRRAGLTGRTLLVDRRTGTTTSRLWPEGDRPAVRETQDVDDWLTVIHPAAHAVRELLADLYRGG